MLIVLGCFLFARANAQSKNEFNGNIKINSSCLSKVINGFYRYIKDKKGQGYNSSEYYVRVNLSSMNDSTDYVELSLYSYKVTELEDNPNKFYGYLKRDNVSFVFSTANRLVTKKSSVSNPKLFNKLKSKYPKGPYDPYGWEFTISKNKIIQKSPPADIEKYIP